MTFKSTKQIFAAFTAMLIIGSHPAGAASKGSFLTKGDIDELFAIEIATMIGKECRQISFSKHQEDKFIEALYARFVNNGWRHREFEEAIDSIDNKALQKRMFAYIDNSGIVFGDRSTFCNAGFKEIEKETSIGTYLRSRRK